ncbi:MAG: hypothetical protein IID37_12505 [Planctomycetes bacterium]|nr:hypothetical protein [Planctomycetota bacterium]
MKQGYAAPRAALVLLTTVALASADEAAQYENYNALTARLQGIVLDHPDVCQLTSVGTSRGGRDLWALQLSAVASPGDASAVLIVAGIDGTDVAGSAVAVELAERVRAAMADGVSPWSELTVHILPRMNPDPMESYFASPQWEQAYALRPWDDDRDGSVDEDGPQDLNGDGWITMMRVRDPEATHLPDKDDVRLLKKADRAVGDVPVFKVYSEGLDDDDDEEINEDPFGGVDLNRNFMHGYEEHTPGAGPYQISEPESRALVDFVLSHPRIAVCMVYGPHDNLINTPSGDKKDETDRAPKGLTKDDVAIYKEIGRIYGELTEVKSVPKRDSGGAFFAWCYAQFGVPTFATPVWTRPEPEKQESEESKKDSEAASDETSDPSAAAADKTESTTPESESATEADDSDETPDGDSSESPANGNRNGKGNGKKKDKDVPPELKEDRAWLKYSDEQRDGDGFVDWQPFTHPTLGEVEIGGFVPFFRNTPPADALGDIVEKQWSFLGDLVGRLPRIEFGEVQVKALSPTVYEIETLLVNRGYFPYALKIGEQNRHVRPLVVTLQLEPDRILGGARVSKVPNVAGGGGIHKLRWVVQGKPGQTVRITVASEKLGDLELNVALAATDK